MMKKPTVLNWPTPMMNFILSLILLLDQKTPKFQKRKLFMNLILSTVSVTPLPWPLTEL
jgi:hypothetical protein